MKLKLFTLAALVGFAGFSLPAAAGPATSKLSWVLVGPNDDGSKTYITEQVDRLDDGTLVLGNVVSLAAPLPIGTRLPVGSFTSLDVLNCQTGMFRTSTIIFWSGPMGDGERLSQQEPPDSATWKPVKTTKSSAAAYRRHCKA